MNWKSYKEKIKEKGKMPSNYYVLGIDLGTTNSVISYYNLNTKKPEPIDISGGFGKIPLPSVVQCRKSAAKELEWIVGEEAFRSMKIYPNNTIRSIKRYMGTDTVINLADKSYSPEIICAKIIQELVQQVYNLDPNAQVAGLVISVPYDFDDAAKKSTIKAVELAGLSEQLICLIEEPKAAALAYNFSMELLQDEKIMVFDFGGGTLDITIFNVAIKNDEEIKLEVISDGGKCDHGGDTVDNILYNKFLEILKEKANIDEKELAIENKLELELRARETKERLSGVVQFRVPFTFCIPPFMEQLTRDDMEVAINSFIEKTKKLVLKTLQQAYDGALTPYNIDRILLEGGSASMPWVKNMLIDIFNDERKIYSSERPALDISVGATYYAAIKMGVLENVPEVSTGQQNVEFDLRVPHDIGLEVLKGDKKTFMPIIRRGTSYYLAKKNHVFTLFANTEEDMTKTNLKVLERMDKEDGIDDCKIIGELAITDLPKRPIGKTKLAITLIVEEENGIVKGYVEDMGYGDEYEPIGYKKIFDLK